MLDPVSILLLSIVWKRISPISKFVELHRTIRSERAKWVWGLTLLPFSFTFLKRLDDKDVTRADSSSHSSSSNSCSSMSAELAIDRGGGGLSKLSDESDTIVNHGRLGSAVGNGVNWALGEAWPLVLLMLPLLPTIRSKVVGGWLGLLCQVMIHIWRN